MKTTLEQLRKSENYFRRLAEDDSCSYGESENYREHANGIAQAVAEMTLLRDRETNTMKLLEHAEALALDKARLDWIEKNALDFEYHFTLKGAPRKNYASGVVVRPVIDAAMSATAEG